MSKRQMKAAFPTPLATLIDAQAAVTTATAALDAARIGYRETFGARVVAALDAIGAFELPPDQLEKWLTGLSQLKALNGAETPSETFEVVVEVGANCGHEKRAILKSNGLRHAGRKHWNGMCDKDQIAVLRASFGSKVTSSAEIPPLGTESQGNDLNGAHEPDTPTPAPPSHGDADVNGNKSYDESGPSEPLIMNDERGSVNATTQQSVAQDSLAGTAEARPIQYPHQGRSAAQRGLPNGEKEATNGSALGA